MSTNATNAWAWYDIDASLPLPQVVTTVNNRMQRLQNAPGMREDTFTSKARVQTTDGTATLIETLAVPVKTTLGVVGYVVARRTGGSAGAAGDGGFYEVKFAAKNEAGTAAAIGSVTVTTVGESQAGWDVTVTFSGGNALVKVTGAANNNVSWRWSRRTFAVST